MKKWIVVLLLFVMLPAYAFAAAEDNTLHVEGVAVVSAQPDQAVVMVGYSEDNAESGVALSKAAEVVAKVGDAVTALGIEAENVRTSSLQTYPYYTEVEGVGKMMYRVEYMLAITVDDLTKLGDVLDAAFAAGANKLYQIAYASSKEDEMYQEALRLAVKKAMAKAEALAQSAGLWLGQITQINEASYFRPQYSRQVFRDEVAYASADAGFGFGGMSVPSDMEITAIVNVTYSIR